MVRSRGLPLAVSFAASAGIGAASIAAGCSGGDQHPPGVVDCTDPACGASGDGGLTGAGGMTVSSGGAANSGGGGGTGMGGGAAGGTSLSGSVTIYADATFEPTTPFTAAGRIGVTGTTRTVGLLNSGHWSVVGAEAAPLLWVDLHATVSGDAMDTLEVIDGTNPTANVVFASRAAFDGVVTSLSSAQSINPARGQIVLKFVTSDNLPVSGVKLSISGQTVAYDAGNTYTDAQGAPPLGATQGRGMAVVVNYVASPFPGGPVTLEYVKPLSNMPTALNLRVANGAVTFRTVVVP